MTNCASLIASLLAMTSETQCAKELKHTERCATLERDLLEPAFMLGACLGLVWGLPRAKM